VKFDGYRVGEAWAVEKKSPRVAAQGLKSCPTLDA